MYKVKYPIIVEGKYDKAFLSSFLDATIITTEGFGVYKNQEFETLVNLIANSQKVIVLTDSDNAGNQIRSHLKNILKNIEIINVFTPQIIGKEKRKNLPSKDGFLGVEGQEKDIILNLLKDVLKTDNQNIEQVTKNDLYFIGLSGKENSKEKRTMLLKELNLPQNLSTNMLLEVINRKYKREEFLNLFKEN